MKGPQVVIAPRYKDMFKLVMRSEINLIQLLSIGRVFMIYHYQEVLNFYLYKFTFNEIIAITLIRVFIQKIVS